MVAVLVIAGYSFEEIKELFNQHSDTEEKEISLNRWGLFKNSPLFDSQRFNL